MLQKLGIALVILGVLGFLFGGASFTTTEQVADVGPVEIETEKERSLPVTPTASGVALAAGAVLIVVARRKGS